jgi:hypothetical protein
MPDEDEILEGAVESWVFFAKLSGITIDLKSAEDAILSQDKRAQLDGVRLLRSARNRLIAAVEVELGLVENRLSKDIKHRLEEKKRGGGPGATGTT